MSGGKRGPRTFLQKRVLVFGESPNDTQAIAELLKALCPELHGMVKPLRRPPVLIKDARSEDIPNRVKRILNLINAEATEAEIICVFAHEDCDAIEPAHERVAKKIELAFAGSGYHVHAVAPAWEMEAWWFLWPGAIKEYRASFMLPDQYKGKSVGHIRNVKEKFGECVKPKSRGATKGFRAYRPSDSPGIAAQVRKSGIVGSPEAQSGSFDRFVNSAQECCQAAFPPSSASDSI